MGYGRRRYERKTNQTTFGLNVTSMTDMFTILLVFLLQTYSSSDVEIIPEKDIRMPSSTAEANPVRSVQISLSAHELKMGKEVIAHLENSDFTRASIDPNDSNFILPLFKALEKYSQETKAKRDLAATDPKVKAPSVEEDGKLLFQADQNLSYQVLRKVMYTASMAGYPKLKLATVVGD